MKISIVYHSESGNTEAIARIIAKGTLSVDSVNVKPMSIADIDEDFLNQSAAVIFGCPTYAGTFSHQMKSWLDSASLKKLEGKLAAVFATENYLGGGADTALMGIVGHLLVGGMLVYSGGVAHGHPYTHFGAVCIREGDEFQQQRALIFGERIAKKAKQLFR
ncbi:MAG: flavodoxin family protein [Prevotellaceae bacterium]|jgi:NAD(P)H dehydrogenase (quinone)|nr:flavodoxin family protein [Prevotellaceae bacterium]